MSDLLTMLSASAGGGGTAGCILIIYLKSLQRRLETAELDIKSCKDTLNNKVNSTHTRITKVEKEIDTRIDILKDHIDDEFVKQTKITNKINARLGRMIGFLIYKDKDAEKAALILKNGYLEE